MVRQGPGALYTRIAITNTYVPLMSWLVDTVGGTIQPHAVRMKGRHQNAGSRPCYDWCLQRTRDCLVFLQAVLPFLMIKREEATRAIGFLRARLGEVQEAEDTSAFDRPQRGANRA